MDIKTHGRDKLLDAWRGISVLLVVLYHLTAFRFEVIFRPHASGALRTGADAVVPWIGRQMLRELEYAGPLGVRIFFVISGFIITTLLLREHERNGRISLSAFYVRRAFRILPPLWLVLGATFICSSVGYIFVNQKSFVTAASFLCNTQPNNCSWFTAHTWSLATEEQFYLVWPLLLTVIGFRAVAPIALALCLLFIGADQASLLKVSWLHNALSGACIAAGALYASSGPFRSLIARAATRSLIFVAVALLFGEPFLVRFDPLKFETVLTPFLIVFVVFSCFRYRASLEKPLVVQVLSKIGLISYGLYLWQQIFLADPTSYLRHSMLEFAPLCALVVVLSYSLVEKPLVEVGTRLSRRMIERGTANSSVAATVVP